MRCRYKYLDYSGYDGYSATILNRSIGISRSGRTEDARIVDTRPVAPSPPENTLSTD